MLESLRLVNFECHVDREFPLQQVTLLSGQNDTGKSSVLKALAALMQSYNSKSLPSIGLDLCGGLVNLGNVSDVINNKAKPEEFVGIELRSGYGYNLSWWFKTWNEQLTVFPLVIGSLVAPTLPDPIYYLSSNLNSQEIDFSLLDTAAPGATLLIEHPESRLHGSAVTALGGAMAYAAARGVQIIVETHSDHLLNAFRLAIHAGELNPNRFNCLHFSRQNQKGGADIQVQEIVFDRRARANYWPANFFDEWDNSLTQLLEPVTQPDTPHPNYQIPT